MHQQFQSCIPDMRVMRDKIEEGFLVIKGQAEKIASSLGVSPSVPGLFQGK